MTELLEKDKKFEWTPTCEASFQELKKQLTTTLILVMSDMEKLFSIYCDVSGQGRMCTHVGWLRGSLCFMTAKEA
jgi:hypothetical protein